MSYSWLVFWLSVVKLSSFSQTTWIAGIDLDAGLQSLMDQNLKWPTAVWSGLLIDQLINLESVMESKISVAVEEDSGDGSKCINN